VQKKKEKRQKKEKEEHSSEPISLHSISNVVLISLKCLSQSLLQKWFGIIPYQNCLT